jgi:hypothetical protein
MKQKNKLMTWLGFAAVFLLATGFYLKSSIAEQAGKIDFALVSHNKSSSLISEARVRFDDGGASWGYIDSGGGAVYSDHVLRLPPTRAVVSWEVDGLKKSLEVLIPKALPIIPAGGALRLVFVFEENGASAHWAIREPLRE